MVYKIDYELVYDNGDVVKDNVTIIALSKSSAIKKLKNYLGKLYDEIVTLNYKIK